MDVTPLVRAGAQIIQGYAGGRFRISGAVYEGAVLVSPERTAAWESAPADFSSLEISHLDALRAMGADVVLIGTGGAFRPLPPVLRSALRAAGINADAMDTGAACRTYNVLMAEGRSVAAALLPCP